MFSEIHIKQKFHKTLCANGIHFIRRILLKFAQSTTEVFCTNFQMDFSAWDDAVDKQDYMKFRIQRDFGLCRFF